MRVEGGREEGRGARGAAASAGDLREHGMEKRMRKAEVICKEQNVPHHRTEREAPCKKVNSPPQCPRRGQGRSDLEA